MKTIFKVSICFILLLFVGACNIDKKETPVIDEIPEEEKEALKRAQNDSIMLSYDSLYNITIAVPPLLDKELFDSTTTIKFFELASKTGGDIKLLANSKLITNEIVDIIESYSEDGTDILFLIDKTGSMADDLSNLQKGLNQIIAAIENYKNVRIAFALYGDKNVDKKEYGFEWFSFKNCETDYGQAKKFINSITVTGGGDYPESVYEGFFESLEHNFWQSENKRMILLIGDAPPLEKPLSSYSISDVITKAKDGKINMNFYPIVVTPTVDETNPRKTYKNEKVIDNLYPNPSFGIINIDFIKNGEYKLEIFDIKGTVVFSEEIKGKNWRKDLYDFEDGVYIIRVQDSNKRFETKKFILKK